MALLHFLGEVALFLALNSEQLSVATLLVDHGADVNVQFSTRIPSQPPQSEAYASESEKPIDDVTEELSERPLLHYFVIMQQATAMKFLLDSNDIDIAQQARFVHSQLKIKII